MHENLMMPPILIEYRVVYKIGSGVTKQLNERAGIHMLVVDLSKNRPALEQDVHSCGQIQSDALIKLVRKHKIKDLSFIKIEEIVIQSMAIPDMTPINRIEY